MRPASPRQQKIAASNDAEVWPLGPMRAAEPLLRAVARGAGGANVFEYGCATGKVTAAAAERLGQGSRILAIDPSPAMIDAAEAQVRSPTTNPKTEEGLATVSFQVGELTPLAVDTGTCDLAISNLALGDLPSPAAALAQFARALKPGGTALVTLPLRGCWSQFLDLYREVLRWMEAAGLEQVTVEPCRWELLFKSAREFFFAPIIEFFPLPVWKQIAGGRGDEMQDVFFFVKEAIETYFSGTVFPVTMVVGLLQGKKRAA
jgi:SAM-dependent methyltransferase